MQKKRLTLRFSAESQALLGLFQIISCHRRESSLFSLLAQEADYQHYKKFSLGRSA
jgi:hypothetical protein